MGCYTPHRAAELSCSAVDFHRIWPPHAARLQASRCRLGPLIPLLNPLLNTSVINGLTSIIANRYRPATASQAPLGPYKRVSSTPAPLPLIPELSPAFFHAHTELEPPLNFLVASPLPVVPQ
jgi:hypothetical protein